MKYHDMRENIETYEKDKKRQEGPQTFRFLRNLFQLPLSVAQSSVRAGINLKYPSANLEPDT